MVHISVFQITVCFRKYTHMVYLNYNNLDAETQQHLLTVSKEDIKRRFGEQLKAFANEHCLNYETLLDEEAVRNLYNYQFVFNI